MYKMNMKHQWMWNLAMLVSIIGLVGCGTHEAVDADADVAAVDGALLDMSLDVSVRDSEAQEVGEAGEDGGSPPLDGTPPLDATDGSTEMDARCLDDDSDMVCNDADQCPGFDDGDDTDGDGTPDGCDLDDVCVRLVGPSLVACYNFDGNFLDASGNANHGSSAGMHEFVESPLGQGVMPGAEAIVVADSPSLDVDNLTVEAWIRVDTHPTGRNRAIIVDNDEQYISLVRPERQTSSTLYLQPDRLVFTFSSNQRLPPAGEWTYYAMTFDGAQITHYVDGTQVRQARATGTLHKDNTNPMHLGSGSPATTLPFRGVMDAIRIWSVARSAEDICRSAAREWVDDVCQPPL